MSRARQRRQQQQQLRREEILDAAAELYGELDWDAVTIDAVARRARLSRPLVYLCLKNKRELNFALAIRAMELLHERFRAARATARTGLQQIETIGLAYYAFGREFPHYFDAYARLELSADHEPDAGVEQLAAKHSSQSIHQVLVAALMEGQQDGSIRADLGDLAVASRALWGFTHGLIQVALTKTPLLAQAGITQSQLTTQAISMIRYTLAARPPAGAAVDRPR